MPHQTNVLQKIEKAIRDRPGQLTIKNVTTIVYGDDHNKGNYNHCHSEITKQMQLGTIDRDELGQLTLTSRRPLQPAYKANQGKRIKSELPYNLPTSLREIEQIQIGVDTIPRLQEIIRSIRKDPIAFKNEFVELGDYTVIPIMRFILELIIYINMMMHEEGDFLPNIKIDPVGNTWTPDEILARLNYFKIGDWYD